MKNIAYSIALAAFALSLLFPFLTHSAPEDMNNQAVPASPAPVPPNSSRILGKVLKYAIWPPGSLKNTMPPIPPERTVYSYQIQIHSSEPDQPALESLAQPGTGIDVFSLDALLSPLVGADIQATVILTGDTRGVRWWISNIQIRH